MYSNPQLLQTMTQVFFNLSNSDKVEFLIPHMTWSIPGQNDAWTCPIRPCRLRERRQRTCPSTHMIQWIDDLHRGCNQVHAYLAIREKSESFIPSHRPIDHQPIPRLKHKHLRLHPRKDVEPLDDEQWRCERLVRLMQDLTISSQQTRKVTL